MKAAIALLLPVVLAPVAQAQTNASSPSPPPAQTLPDRTSGPVSPSAMRPRSPDRPDHWFYDMLDRSDARHLIGKTPTRRTPPSRQ
ncbi:hypothetical protein ACFSM5_02595 [Lacibacterium aquatile]|uniref:Uncharacterized protein n=1 Tax=Lacibacterium aquatile TaxID=1168082 RepID=A0ABW5DR20_9PROT